MKTKITFAYFQIKEQNTKIIKTLKNYTLTTIDQIISEIEVKSKHTLIMDEMNSIFGVKNE